jgi:hypothetical protein
MGHGRYPQHIHSISRELDSEMRERPAWACCALIHRRQKGQPAAWIGVLCVRSNRIISSSGIGSSPSATTSLRFPFSDCRTLPADRLSCAFFAASRTGIKEQYFAEVGTRYLQSLPEQRAKAFCSMLNILLSKNDAGEPTSVH